MDGNVISATIVNQLGQITPSPTSSSPRSEVARCVDFWRLFSSAKASIVVGSPTAMASGSASMNANVIAAAIPVVTVAITM